MRKISWSRFISFEKVPLPLLLLLTKIDFYYLNQANIQTHNAYKVDDEEKLFSLLWKKNAKNKMNFMRSWQNLNLFCFNDIKSKEKNVMWAAIFTFERFLSGSKHTCRNFNEISANRIINTCCHILIIYFFSQFSKYKNKQKL